MYTGRGPVCGMMTRGGALTEAGGLDAVACICVDGADGGTAADAVGVGAAGGAGRGGIATAAGLEGTAGGVAIGFGVTTGAGGRAAATDAGVTNLGAGGSTAGFAGVPSFA